MLINNFGNLIRTNIVRSIYRQPFLAGYISNFSTNVNNKTDPESVPKNEKANESDESKNQINVDIEKLTSENKTLLDTVKDLDDKYKRALAEAENTRLRSKKQIDDAKIYAIQGFCKDLLEVADIFKSAIESVPKEPLQSNIELKNLYDGVVMTEQKLLNVFQRHGLCQINPIGCKFNPNEHHALFQAEDPGKEPGTVSTVTKIGFKLHDRTIRPAMVGVVKSPE